ncbi:MAG: YkgJ family cysteine cluster protein [Bacteroidota bacterium]
MAISPDELNRNASKIERENRKFYDRLLKHKRPGLEEDVVDLHHQVFDKIDCLACANCCKTISPVFKERDIARLASHLGLKPAQVVVQYLRTDEDGDYVPNSIPCPFLLSDNRCKVYDARPFACSSYPHTDSLPLRKSVNLVVKNSAVCPGVHEITRLLAEKYSTV